MKTTQNTILTTLLVSALTVGITFAQGPGGRGGPSGGGRPPHGPPPGGGPGGGKEDATLPPIVKALDKDQDGSISEDEIKEAVDSLKSLDENNDGKLTADELRPERPPGAPVDEDRGARGKPHVPPIIRALDTSEDGEISTEEIEAAPASLIVLDHNEDGKLSRMEIRPKRRFKPKKKED